MIFWVNASIKDDNLDWVDEKGSKTSAFLFNSRGLEETANKNSPAFWGNHAQFGQRSDIFIHNTVDLVWIKVVSVRHWRFSFASSDLPIEAWLLHRRLDESLRRRGLFPRRGDDSENFGSLV